MFWEEEIAVCCNIFSLRSPYSSSQIAVCFPQNSRTNSLILNRKLDALTKRQAATVTGRSRILRFVLNLHNKYYRSETFSGGNNQEIKWRYGPSADRIKKLRNSLPRYFIRLLILMKEPVSSVSIVSVSRSG
jgi:hypothetical protein